MLNSCKELVLPYSELKQLSELSTVLLLLPGRKLGEARQGGIDVFAFLPSREEESILGWCFLFVFFFVLALSLWSASVADELWEL